MGRDPRSARRAWSCRFEPLEERFLLSVAPAIDKSLLLSDDALVQPVGPTAADYDASEVSSAGPTGLFCGDAETQTAQFQFHFDGTPLVEYVADAAMVTLDGEQTWLSAGEPVMPVHNATVLLPAGMRLTAVEASYADEGLVIAEGVQLLAAPVAVPFTDGVESVDDWTAIASGSLSQQEAVHYANHTVAGYQVATLRVFPVEYDAAADTLTYHSQVSVTVTAGAAEEPTAAVRDSEADRLRVAELVENPDALDSYSTSTTAAPTGSSMLPAEGQYQYVVVTGSALESSFQALVDQKISRGLSARIVTTEYISANYSGSETGDKADKIRSFIADAYANWGTQWVLLGGDRDVVPERGVYASVGSTVDVHLPTDLYYACLDGPWNGDGDQLWGEWNDGTAGGDIDLMPEVYIGRAPVSNLTEAANFVAKTIQYETTSHPNATTAVWLGEQLDADTWGSYSSIPIRDRAIPGDWTLVERYDSAGGWSGADFLGDLNASPHLVNHLGHANETYNARLVSADVAALTNPYPYFMYSQGCKSGSFDTHDLAIAEQHVVDDHGAFAVVMNSRYGWYMPGSTPGGSHYYALEFWDAVFNEGMTHLGQANQDSKDDNLFRVGSTGVYRWIHLETNLFGDPETPLQIGDGFGPSGQIRGTLWEDVNGDGQAQPDEAPLAGHTVFLDSNDNGLLEVGTVTTATSDVSVPLVDYGTVTSTLVVSGAATIGDVNVTLNVTHTYDSDLAAYLISPSGTRVELFSHVGDWGDNFVDTTLDDEADTPIGDALAPFTGAFLPGGRLSRFDGEDPNGTWTLEIADTMPWDTGTLHGWSLEITGEEPYAQTGADGTYVFAELADGTYRVRHQLPTGWTHTHPVDGLHLVSVQEGAVVEGVDFLASRDVADPAVVDLGQVDFLEIADIELTGLDQWYSCQTTHEGLLTIEAHFDGSPEDIQINLYDANFTPLATATPLERAERIDWRVVAGQRYNFALRGNLRNVRLRLANLIHENAAHMTVYGTDGDDRFEFTAADPNQVTINGVVYEVQDASGNAVEFDGGLGRDTAILLGSDAPDVTVLEPGRAGLVGPGYKVLVTNTEDIRVTGGGGRDVAVFYDSAGNDTFVATPDYGHLYGAGFSNRAVAFPTVHAYATEGGTDVAKLYDSAGNDTFAATPDYGALYGDGFYNRAVAFRYVYAWATAGGTDVAKLWDSPGNDVFAATPEYGALSGDGFYNRAVAFRYVYAWATAGGTNLAKLYDSPGNDVLVATPDCATLCGDGFLNRAVSFRNVYAWGSAGGNDVAKLHDSPGDDLFVATPDCAVLYGGGFYSRATAFRYVHAYAKAGGLDTAKLYDSAGNDTFVATPDCGVLHGDGFYNRADSFRYVHGYATAGGDDVAKLYDSAGNDLLLATSKYAALSGDGFYNRAVAFRYVNAFAVAGGDDVARLYDSALADHLEAGATWARLFNDDAELGFSNWVDGFDLVTAYSRGGEDVATIDPAALDWLVADGWD